jgi:ribonuclease P protein component
VTNEALPRKQRVRRRPEFERAYNTGVRIHGRFMTVFVVSNGTITPRFGVAATKKLGSAVERNLAKRRSRELFRRHKVAAGLDIIIVPRRDLLDAPFTSIEADYIATLRRSRNAEAGTGPRHSSRRARDTSRI